MADGELSAGTLVAFLSTALALRWPVESIGFLLAMSQEAATATDRYFEVMDEPEPEDRAHGRARSRDRRAGRPHGRTAGPAAEPGADCASTASGSATPTRPPDSPPVLDGIDLHIRPGETMALVGATGSGQDHPHRAGAAAARARPAGRITLDGEDIARRSPRDELRALVAVAFEEPTLFSATVARERR